MAEMMITVRVEDLDLARYCADQVGFEVAHVDAEMFEIRIVNRVHNVSFARMQAMFWDEYATQLEIESDETHAEPTEDKYRVWWIPQIPGTAFKVEVPNLDVAKFVCATLGQYDIFQYEHNIKPDFANMGGIEKWDATDGEWYSVDESEYK